MRASLLVDTIKSIYAGNRRAVCVEGPPGVGKTSLIQKAAEELGVEYVEVHLPTIPPEDMGIPVPDLETNTHKHTIPHWWPKDPNSRGILCFDDRNQASGDMQKVLANICQARNLHGNPLPDGWMVVSTGNRQKDRSGSNRVLSHLRNRETVFTLSPDLDDWLMWAYNNDVRPEVIAFLQFKADRFCLEDMSKVDEETGAFPSPRSWTEGVSPVIGVIPQPAEFEAFSGAVGAAAAGDFVAFLKVHRELPDIADVLKNPDKAHVPSGASSLYAIVGSLVGHANKTNVDSIFKYVNRLPAEYGALFFSNINMKDQSLLRSSPEFVKWAKDNTDIIVSQSR